MKRHSKNGSMVIRMIREAACVSTALLVGAQFCMTPSFANYKGAARTYLFDPSSSVCFRNTTKFKKNPPYVIGFSDAGQGDIWRVIMRHAIQQAAADRSDKIGKLIITDANHDDNKQVGDIQDLMNRGIDIMIVSANTQQALDSIVGRVSATGMPVVMVDRNVKTQDNYVSFVGAPDAVIGRLFAQWIVEKLGGKGDIVMIGGKPGTSVSDTRVKAAQEVFAQHKDINIIEIAYSDWSAGKAKQITSALVAKYGKGKIQAIWSADGLHDNGIIEALIEAGYKKGEFPPITAGNINGPLLYAQQYDIPMLDIGNSPHMGYDAVEVALKVLEGTTLPCRDDVNMQITVDKKDETASIKGDREIKDLVDPKGAPDKLTEAGLGSNYDPATFSVNYPK